MVVQSGTLRRLTSESSSWPNGKQWNGYRIRRTQLHCSLEEAQSPLSRYLELNDILLSNIISNKIDFDWQPFLKPWQRRNQLFDLMPISNDVQRQNFWYRSAKLANLLHPMTNRFQPEGLRARLVDHYWKHFEDTYNPQVPCTWRKLCLRPTCRQSRC